MFRISGHDLFNPTAIGGTSAIRFSVPKIVKPGEEALELVLVKAGYYSAEGWGVNRIRQDNSGALWNVKCSLVRSESPDPGPDRFEPEFLFQFRTAVLISEQLLLLCGDYLNESFVRIIDIL